MYAAMLSKPVRLQRSPIAACIAVVAMLWLRRPWVTHHPASTSDGAIPSIPSPAKCNSATPTKRLFTPSRIAHGPKPCVCHWLSAARVSRKASAAEPDATACSASWSAISGTRIRRSVESAIASGVCEPSTRRTVGHPPSALLARTERPSPRRPVVARTSFLQPQQMPASAASWPVDRRWPSGDTAQGCRRLAR